MASDDRMGTVRAPPVTITVKIHNAVSYTHLIDSPKEHWELGPPLRVFDFERGVKIAESRFTVLMEMGAKMERALMNFMLDFHSSRGYREVFPPILVNKDCMFGTCLLYTSRCV